MCMPRSLPGLTNRTEYKGCTDFMAASAVFWAERDRPFFAVFLDPRHELALPELFRPKGAAA